MEIYAVLKRENAKILAALRKLESTSSHQPEARQQALHTLKSHLATQRQVEENRLYPLLLASPKTYGMVGRARQENGEIETLLAQLEAADPRDHPTRFLLESLSSAIHLHVSWEENELFPQARSVIPAEQAELLGEAAAGEQEALYHRFLNLT